MKKKLFLIILIFLTVNVCVAQESKAVKKPTEGYSYSPNGFRLMRGEFRVPNSRFKMEYDGVYSADGKILIMMNSGNCIKPGTEVIAGGSCVNNQGILRIPQSVKYISENAFTPQSTALTVYDDKKVTEWEIDDEEE